MKVYGRIIFNDFKLQMNTEAGIVYGVRILKRPGKSKQANTTFSNSKTLNTNILPKILRINLQNVRNLLFIERFQI